ncbi:MAG: 2-succinyl-5-enolpyruvyl-6-hydroxy-3-cyclohexene-1-carboxylic-acid synthase [Deltaproteobacteria bacterium]|nr:2-succinyl-5-enolpyruvyl-6-hydroxy-3-cyclohexene-1-carboxylic-acid synthase [Deltaproteobacteria bacterium]MBN2670604.1 2-succinyl-5-enolpyruvyl-6-hydroxy-3-cyclohexene-1-carboxylic-acid synthase [Deltaproteobacteria bacterium]
MIDIYKQWTHPFFHALISAGVTQVVISPGSRSTPLALTALQHAAVQCHVVLDERSAAFFALGQVRITGIPTVLICTSGSAGAHYFPAVIEAEAAHLPLILITADRPWELQHCGANQTIHQPHLFGSHVKRFFELGEPVAHNDAMAAVSRIAAQAVQQSLCPNPGPVHINARFRKPLEPEVSNKSVSAPINLSTVAIPPVARVPEHAIEKLAAVCRTFQRGIIVCGPGPMPQDSTRRFNALTAFAQATGYPVLAESASGVRRMSDVFIENASAFFAADVFHTRMPDIIIECHRPLTTGAYEKFLHTYPSIPRIVLSEDAYVDAQGTANMVITGEVTNTLTRATIGMTAAPDETWAASLHQIDKQITHTRQTFVEEAPFCDATALSTIIEMLKEDATLCIGNSLVIRDTDLFAPPVCAQRILHQRGASGIDGGISGAAGSASCLDSPVVVLVGDLAALHDLGGFALLAQATSPLVVVILNNNGGQIFSQLPIAQIPEIDAELNSGFILPGTPDFEGVCTMFQLPYLHADNRSALIAHLNTALGTPGASVVNVQLTAAPDFRKRFIEDVKNTLSLLTES